MVFVQILNFIKKEAILHKNLVVDNKIVFGPMLLASDFFYSDLLQRVPYLYFQKNDYFKRC